MSPLESMFSKAEMIVSVDKMAEGKVVARPGDKLEVNVEFTPKKDFYVRRATVELVRIDRHVSERTVYDSDFGLRGRKTVHSQETERHVIFTVTFLEDENVYANEKQTSEIRVTIPSDILPTVIGIPEHGVKPGIFYELRTTLDIPKALDVREAYELLIV